MLLSFRDPPCPSWASLWAPKAFEVQKHPLDIQNGVKNAKMDAKIERKPTALSNIFVMWSIIVAIWHLLLVSFYKFIERNAKIIILGMIFVIFLRFFL